ncbi:hypothetical protein [Methylocystis sp.]|uniref:bestrophin-like domain n=1 Tax=Methylocystis sp. TaxID=1911079 RepID=UPI0025E7A343|nr:hypothetical protein [Methylocystis sp.]
MIFTLFALAAAVVFFFSSLALLNYGRRLGARHLAKEGASSMAGLNAVEGAVFALMGLLLAFSLSGALQRFDERRQLVLQEVNAIGTAYDRLAFLEREKGLKLRAKLKAYVQARIDLYRLPIDLSLSNWSADYSTEQLDKILALKAEVWDEAVAACSSTGASTACSLILTSLGNVFDLARLRSGINERHPPIVIFITLFGLALAGSLLAGFGMAAAKKRSWIHIVAFALALATTLYIITEIEYPRLGFIRVDAFDHFLTEAHARMK